MGRLRHATSKYLTRRDIAGLLTTTAKWLKQQHDLELQVEAQTKGERHLPDKPSLVRLSAHIEEKQGAAIIDADGHWTVVRGVEGQRLVVLDSSGQRYIPALAAT